MYSKQFEFLFKSLIALCSLIPGVNKAALAEVLHKVASDLESAADELDSK
jgi:hypothetical protein